MTASAASAKPWGFWAHSAIGKLLREQGQAEFDELVDGACKSLPLLQLDGAALTDSAAVVEEMIRVWEFKDTASIEGCFYATRPLEEMLDIVVCSESEWTEVLPPYVVVLSNSDDAKQCLGHSDRLAVMQARLAEQSEEIRKILAGEDSDAEEEDTMEDRKDRVADTGLNENVAETKRVIAELSENRGETTFDKLLQHLQRRSTLEAGIYFCKEDGDSTSSPNIKSTFPPSDLDTLVGWHLSRKNFEMWQQFQSKASEMSPALVLDGSTFKSIDLFYDEVEVAWGMMSEDWGRNLDAFNDILRGGFGEPTKNPPFRLVIRNAQDAQGLLGHCYRIEQLQKRRETADESWYAEIDSDIEEARAGRGKTTWDELLEIMQEHENDGVHICLEG